MTVLPAGAGELLAGVGIAANATSTRLAGGMNNQVFRVTGADGRSVVVKAYFHDAQDRRDRLGAEFGFLTAAQDLRVTCVAKPLARDAERHVGVYTFLEGRLPSPADVTAAAIDQALAFLMRLNPAAAHHAHLPVASEACFSGSQHVGTVDRRLERLVSALGSAAVERDAAHFLGEAVGPLWARIRNGVVEGLARLGIDPAAEIAASERVLSPSDFGFHNALKSSDGAFAFVDFEYAGWDDPAKLIGDAFNQVKVPIPSEFYPVFREAFAARSAHPETAAARYDLMRAVYGIKWVLIILNDFIPLDERRRAFAADTADRRAAQLAAARVKLAKVADECKNMSVS